MDIAAISAAVTSLRVAGDIAKGLISLNTMTEVQSKAIELNQMIISAQHDIFAANTAQTALVDRIRDLEKEIAAIKAWDGEKQRYKMVTPFSGGTVYALKKSMSDGEPAHYICANCFQNGKRSILQITHDKDSFAAFACQIPSCKSSARTGHRGRESANYAEDIT